MGLADYLSSEDVIKKLLCANGKEERSQYTDLPQTVLEIQVLNKLSCPLESSNTVCFPPGTAPSFNDH